MPRKMVTSNQTAFVALPPTPPPAPPLRPTMVPLSGSPQDRRHFTLGRSTKPPR